MAHVAAVPGQDTGALATPVAEVNQKAVEEQNGTLQIDADPTGQLKFLASSATATRRQGHDPDAEQVLGARTTSRSPGPGVNQVGAIVSNGGTSTVSATLKPGSYTFYCSVDGHRAAGMVGTLTVK